MTSGSVYGWFNDECGGTDVLAGLVCGVFPCVLAGGGGGVVAAANPLAVVESDTAQVSVLPMESDTARVSALPVVGVEVPAVLYWEGRLGFGWFEGWTVVSPIGSGGNPAGVAGRARCDD